MKKVLWLGPIVPPQDVAKYKAVSAAANVWQLGFIGGLVENNVDVTLVSYVPYPTWPRGPLWARRPMNSINLKCLEQLYFSYLNISYIREIWIAAIYIVLSLTKISDIKLHHIFTYNPYPRNRIAARCLRFISSTKWISIIADNRTFGNPDFHLFLSYDYFKRFNKKGKLFCDGGIIQRSLSEKNGKDSVSESSKSLIFAGGLNNWTGIIDFIDLFSKIDTENYILNIYGKGDPNILMDKMSGLQKKVILHGFVSDSELDMACRNAFAFINPRPLNMFRCENDFPSKLLLYLSYNKPIISTRSKGLSPDYDNILLYYSDLGTLKQQFELINDTKCYNDAITRISKFNPDNSWGRKVQNVIKSIWI